jgi:hypothetical protein
VNAAVQFVSTKGCVTPTIPAPGAAPGKCTTFVNERATTAGNLVSLGGLAYGMVGIAWETCRDACQVSAACKQVLWNAGTGACFPMSEAGTTGNAESGWISAQCDEIPYVPQSASLSATNGPHTAARCIDGDLDTFCITDAASTPDWIMLDLGTDVPISRVDVFHRFLCAPQGGTCSTWGWYGHYNSGAITIEIKSETGDWQTCFTSAAGVKGTIRGACVGTARFVRVTGSAAEVQLSELHVYPPGWAQVFEFDDCSLATATTLRARGLGHPFFVNGGELAITTATTLDAQGLGRFFFVNGGSLTISFITLKNAVSGSIANNPHGCACKGNAIFIQSGSVDMYESSIIDCRPEPSYCDGFAGGSWDTEKGPSLMVKEPGVLRLANVVSTRSLGVHGSWTKGLSVPGYTCSGAGVLQSSSSGSDGTLAPLSCLPCAAGQFQPAVGLACSECPGGKFQYWTAQSSCTNCTSGLVSDSGATACGCPVGQYGQLAGAGTVCKSCEVAKYQPAVAQVECTSCSAGKSGNSNTASTAESVACSSCGSGQYQPVAGQASCTGCAAGKHRNGNAASSEESVACSSCGSGKYQPAAGQVNCAGCAAGKHRNGNGASSEESVACSGCGSGKFQPTPGSTDCIKCAAGKRGNGNNASIAETVECTSCDSGTYQPLSAQANCIGCVAGRHRVTNVTTMPVLDLSTRQPVQCSSMGYQRDKHAIADMKCPNTDDRLFTVAAATLQDCAAKCAASVGCARFSFNAADAALGSNAACMGCAGGVLREAHSGYELHSLAATSYPLCSKAVDGENATSYNYTLRHAGKHCQSYVNLRLRGFFAEGVSVGTEGLNKCLQATLDHGADMGCNLETFQFDGGVSDCGCGKDVCASTAQDLAWSVYTVEPSPGNSWLSNAVDADPWVRVQLKAHTTNPSVTYHGTTAQNTSDSLRVLIGTTGDLAAAAECATMTGTKGYRSTSTVTCAGSGTFIWLSSTGGPGKYFEVPEFTVVGPASQIESSACAACGKGTSQPATAQLSCLTCAAGQVSIGAAVLCTNCTAGKYQPTPGSTDCINCDAGRYQNATAQALCKKCTAGQFQEGEAATVCASCSPGKFGEGTLVHEAESVACERCVPGKYQGKAGQEKCRFCPTGQFQGAPQATECMFCTGSKTTAAAGALSEAHCSVLACPPGTFNDVLEDQCIFCPTGKFQDRSGGAPCRGCPVGKHQGIPGRVFCDSCVVGKRGVGINATAEEIGCGACPAGRYQIREGQADCPECPAGTISPLRSTSECSDCAVGRVAAKTGLSECAACVSGRMAQEARSTSCRPCLPGQYQDTSGARACASCVAGRFQSIPGQDDCNECETCEGGTRLRCGGSTEGFCIDCPAGKYYSKVKGVDKATSRCTGCPAGWWCMGGKRFSCGGANLFCPANSANPISVAIGHFSVPTNASADHRVGQEACEEGFSCARGVHQKCPPGRVCQVSGLQARVFVGDEEVTVNVTTESLCAEDEFVYAGGCAPCPERGAKCTDGLVELLPEHWYDPAHGPLAEFWGKRSKKELPAFNNIYRCAQGSCTLEGGLPACTKGRTGTLCAVCDNDYYVTDSLECKACPSSAHAGQYVGALLFVLALCVCGWKAKRHVEMHHPKLAAVIREKLPEVLKLLTGLLQILGSFTAVLYRVPWPGSFQSVTSFFSVVNLDVFALPTVRCSSLGSTYFARFMLHITFMLVATALFVALLIYAYSKHNLARVKPVKTSLVWNVFLPFLFLIYPSISRTVILMLRCRMINGVSYLLSDISISCETAEYAAHRSYAIFGVLVFPIGIVVFFTTLVGYNRHKLPPDWWPSKAPEQMAVSYGKYCAKTHPPEPLHVWKAAAWEPQVAKYEKIYKRIGFLTSTYTRRYWWFESLVTIYKLAMTVLVMFVSDSDELKILFGMLGATAMMAFFSFYQPFRHRDILSINTVAQLVVLLVLFAAMFLLLTGGDSTLIAIALVCLTFAPLVAGVVLTLRLPEEALGREAGDTLSQDLSHAMASKLSAPKLSSVLGSFRRKSALLGSSSKLKKKTSRAVNNGNPVASEPERFGGDNPMHLPTSKKERPPLERVESTLDTTADGKRTEQNGAGQPVYMHTL